MILEDWHTHSSLCRHAKGSLEEYVKTAIKMNLSTIGLSAHFPYEFLKKIEHLRYKEYAMPLNELNKFLNDANSLKEKYQRKINVRIGFEIDYIKEQEDLHLQYLKPLLNDLDYIIGSIHNLQTDFMGLFPFDDSRCVKYYKNYRKIDDLFLQYYKTLNDMVNSKKFKFNIVGHFDLPKKFNKYPEDDGILLEEISKILEICKKRGIVIELNSSGLRKPIKEQYPNEKIINLMREEGNELLLGSDAHIPNEIAFRFKSMHNLLRKYSFTKITHFEDFKKSYINI